MNVSKGEVWKKECCFNKFTWDFYFEGEAYKTSGKVVRKCLEYKITALKRSNNILVFYCEIFLAW